MARTWSNRKVTDYVSPVVRERNRPSSASVFAAALITLVIFFIGLMTYVTIRMESHPPREQVQQKFGGPDEVR